VMATPATFKDRSRAAALKAYKQLKQAEDPTTLFCTNCGEAYPLNSPRVVSALKVCNSQRKAHPQGDHPATAELCWVCTRLKNSVQAYEGIEEGLRNI
jgi:hypothetical protein